MRVLVTGAAGFIGSHLVDHLCKQEIDVVGIDNLDPVVHKAPPGYLNQDVDYRFVDVRNLSLGSGYHDVEAIVHLAAMGGVRRAAREPALVIDNNAVGTARLVQQAHNLPNLKRFILMSSFSVYGNAYTYCIADSRTIPAKRHPEDLNAGRFGVYCPKTGEQGVICPIREGAPIQPLETYGASKAMQELCLAGFEAANIGSAEIITMRASSVVGPRMRWFDEDATIIARIAGWLSDGQRPVIYEDGLQCRDWIAVNDVIEAISRLISKPDVPPVINLCSGVPTTLLQACQHIASTIGVGCDPVIKPQARPGDMRDCLGDATALTSLLGRKPILFEEAAASMFATSFSSMDPD
jgi:dTDP-L-rhamnose 4-epimerase